MNRLIPTQIVDRNGRSTTVHKKDVQQPASARVGSIKPTLSKPPHSRQETVVIKGRPLHKDSIALKLFDSDWDRQYELTSSKGEFSWREEVELPKSSVFEYMRLGVDITDAATLYGLGYKPEDLADTSEIARFIPSRLQQIVKSGTKWLVRNNEAINAFESAGISLEQTEKALNNGLQDTFLNRALNEHQLAELFTKWKYSSVAHDSLIKKTKKDEVIHGFVNGVLPFECKDIPVSNLHEINFELSIMMQGDREEIMKDHDLYVRMIRKAAASTMTGYNRVFDLNRMVSKHGVGVLDLDDPHLCAARLASGTDAGLENALYFEEVHRYVKELGLHLYVDEATKYGYKGNVRVDGEEMYNNDLAELREAGISPSEAYEGLILRKLSPTQIIVAKEDGLAGSLSDGAL